jgi:hypothetical protein
VRLTPTYSNFSSRRTESPDTGDVLPELTPYEQELLANPGEIRGYTPRDGVAEPTVAPAEPASASAPASESATPDASESSSAE